jgi:hypothetical protein
MAVTITQEPDKFTPSDNPVVYEFKQPLTASGNPKYNVSFVVKAFINGAEIGTFEAFPELVTSDFYGKINLSDKIRGYITNHSVSAIGGSISVPFLYDTQNYVETHIEIREKYSIFPEIDPEIQVAVTTSSNTIAFKGSLSRSEFKVWDYSEYKKGSLSKGFLTERKYISQYGITLYTATEKKGDITILSYFDNSDLDTPTSYNVLFTYILPSGNVTQTNLFDSGNQGYVSAIRFNLQEQLDLALITQSTYDNCTGVIIAVQNLAGTGLIRPYSITFSDACFDKGASLLWLNKFGSYDNYRFTYNSRVSAKIESKSFSKRQGEWTASNNNYNVNNNTFGRINYLKTITKQLELSSDWLTEDQQAYVVNVYESPLVYINEGTEVENVVITNSAYQLKQSEHDELFNEIVNIEFTDKKSITL